MLEEREPSFLKRQDFQFHANNKLTIKYNQKKAKERERERSVIYVYAFSFCIFIFFTVTLHCNGILYIEKREGEHAKKSISDIIYILLEFARARSALQLACIILQLHDYEIDIIIIQISFSLLLLLVHYV